MNGDPERIVITDADLNDPRVEEALQQQLSFGMAARPPRIEDRGTKLIYRPWFALTLAGALGAFCGWALIEPVFDDGVRFDGRVEQVIASEIAGGVHSAGTLTVAGTQVWVGRDVTDVRRDGESVGFASLTVGNRVEVEGNVVFTESLGLVAANRVTILAGESEETAPVALKSLEARGTILGFAIFPLIAGLVGLFIGAADGLLSRALRRAVLGALIGVGSGIGFGLVAGILSQLVYTVGTAIVAAVDDPTAVGFSPLAFVAQMMARGIAWSLAGAAAGLGQGIAMRSRRLLVNGLLGGMVGALVGGLMFDPIDYLVHGGLGGAGAEVSRAIGFVAIGAATGLMIGVVELLAREAWVKMLTGPLAGKEFILYKDPTVIGSSPKADIFLFKDSDVEPTHALIHTVGEGYEIEDLKTPAGTIVDGVSARRRRLEDGSQVRIGKTVFSVSIKESE